MSLSRWALSAFIVWYLVSLVVAAVPGAATLEAVRPVRHAPYDRVSGYLAPWFDSAAGVVAHMARRISASVDVVRPATGEVLTQAGMAQRWDMFANPLRTAQYLRVKWYVAATSGGSTRPRWSGTKLVLPTSREDRVRGVTSFRDFSLDRPLAGAIDRDHPSGAADPESLRKFERALRPAIHYFTRQFEETRLGPDEHVVRVEAWHGTAAIPPPYASTEDHGTGVPRLQALRNYYDGVLEEPVIDTTYPPYFAVQNESDIRWTLEYIESR